MQLGLDVSKTANVMSSMTLENTPKQKDLPPLPDKRVAQTILDLYLACPANELFPVLTKAVADALILSLYDRNMLMEPPSPATYALFYVLLAFATKLKEGWNENREWEMAVNSESYLKAVYSLVPDLLFDGGDLMSTSAVLALVCFIHLVFPCILQGYNADETVDLSFRHIQPPVNVHADRYCSKEVVCSWSTCQS